MNNHGGVTFSKKKFLIVAFILNGGRVQQGPLTGFKVTASADSECLEAEREPVQSDSGDKGDAGKNGL